MTFEEALARLHKAELQAKKARQNLESKRRQY